MRKRSEELISTSSLIDIMFPTFLFDDMQDQLEQNIQKLSHFFILHKNDSKIMQSIIQKLYYFVFLCHRSQVAQIYSTFCLSYQIKLVQKPFSKLFPNKLLPNVTQIGEALKYEQPFKFPYIEPIPGQITQLVNNIFLINGFLPHFQRLLLIFPTYLQKYTSLYQQLLQKQSCLQQSVCYFISICSASEYGCLYMVNRLVKRYLQIGGQEQWLQGNKIPLKIKKILILGHKIAYSPWDLSKLDIKKLIGSGKQDWTEQQIIHAGIIMGFSHMFSTFALGNGLQSQNINLDETYFNLKFLDKILKSQNSIILQQQKQISSKTSKTNNQQLQQLFILDIKSYKSTEISQQNHLNLSQTQFLEYLKQNIQKSNSRDQQLLNSQQYDYMKQINQQMKKLQVYQLIHSIFKNILPPYAKISRRNEHTTTNLQYSEYNFQFNAYPYLSNNNQQVANKVLSLIQYCKQMSQITKQILCNYKYGTIKNKSESFNFSNSISGIHTISTRRAIRYYVENLAGYIHLQYNYKTNMTNFLSKQLKFYIKLLIFQPFLLRKSVIQNIPHQNSILSEIDIIYASLIVISILLEKCRHQVLIFYDDALQGSASYSLMNLQDRQLRKIMRLTFMIYIVIQAINISPIITKSIFGEKKCQYKKQKYQIKQIQQQYLNWCCRKMSFFDKLRQDKWFAFANVTLFGIVGYLAYTNYTSRNSLNNGNQNLNHKKFQKEGSNSNYLKEHTNQKINIPRNPNDHPIYKICITGGPCAGKTTSIEQIKQRFTDLGYRVFVVPEVPTMIVKSGGMILMGKLTQDERITFQALLIKLQIYFQDYFSKLAAMSNIPSIILCDRGVMDPYAYISPDEFQTLLDQEGWNVVNLRDKRYDAVIFLVTAADGAQQHYTLANNVARSQGVDLAKQLDRKTQKAWNGHPHLSIIPNILGETFKQKIQRAILSVQKCIGINSIQQTHLKYTVLKYQLPLTLAPQIFEVEQIFLQPSSNEVLEDKIRKRGQQNSFSYSRTLKFKTKNFAKRPITALQYLQLVSTRRNKKFNILKKQRTTFVYEKQSFIIDKILLEEPIIVLRFSVKKGEEKDVKIPNFVSVGEEVSHDPKYSTYQLSKAR